jgi:hypothetical protein
MIFALFLRASREQVCHTAFFLKCLRRATPFDSSDSLKCLPNRSGNLKCLLYRCVAIQFSFHFFDGVVCSEIVLNCSPSALVVQWFMLVHWFVP